MSKFIHLCPECDSYDGNIFSVVQIDINKVEITYICNGCGFMHDEIHYVYQKPKTTI